MGGGWIVLDRKILQWGWYDDPNTFRLFVHPLLTVNWKEGEWHGIKIARGERITSYQTLADELEVSRSTIRRCVKKLTQTGEIDAKSGQSWTLFKVSNFNKYQNIDAHERPIKGQPTIQPVNQPEANRRYTIEQSNNNKQSLTREQRDGLAPGATRPKEYQDRLELIRKRRDEGRRKWEEEHEDE